MKATIVTAALFASVSLGAPAFAQFGGLTRGLQRAQEIRQSLTFTDEEEHELGAGVSDMLREKYGVVQDPAVHKYVTLVGTVLAQAGSRPSLGWTFIVLDTDGVNAFAAPGGFVHITRGALSILRSEAELADVLAHEISHITEKHTMDAIRNARGIETATANRSEFIQGITGRVYEMVLENNFDRGDEMEADRVGVTLANQVGYAPTGLGAFLTRLADRNKALRERSGLFASHPDTTARLDALGKLIASARLTAAASVADRYRSRIAFPPVPPPAVEPAAAGGGGSGGGGRLGMSGLNPLARERSSSQTVSSAGSRGVNPDRDAPGGPNKSLVPVTVSAAEIAEFRRGITG
jgi:predicted Zn-dependent protease